MLAGGEFPGQSLTAEEISRLSDFRSRYVDGNIELELTPDQIEIMLSRRRAEKMASFIPRALGDVVEGAHKVRVHLNERPLQKRLVLGALKYIGAVSIGAFLVEARSKFNRT